MFTQKELNTIINIFKEKKDNFDGDKLTQSDIVTHLNNLSQENENALTQGIFTPFLFFDTNPKFNSLIQADNTDLVYNLSDVWTNIDQTVKNGKGNAFFPSKLFNDQFNSLKTKFKFNFLTYNSNKTKSEVADQTNSIFFELFHLVLKSPRLRFLVWCLYSSFTEENCTSESDLNLGHQLIKHSYRWMLEVWLIKKSLKQNKSSETIESELERKETIKKITSQPLNDTTRIIKHHILTDKQIFKSIEHGLNVLLDSLHESARVFGMSGIYSFVSTGKTHFEQQNLNSLQVCHITLDAVNNNPKNQLENWFLTNILIAPALFICYINKREPENFDKVSLPMVTENSMLLMNYQLIFYSNDNTISTIVFELIAE